MTSENLQRDDGQISMYVSQRQPLAQQIVMRDEEAPEVLRRQKWRRECGVIPAPRQRKPAPQRINVVLKRGTLDIGFA